MKNMVQIAKELNVSAATVSYVYNNKWREKRISESLADKISEKLKQENFRPNFLGKQLRLGKTMTIGVVMPDLNTLHSLELLNGMEMVLAEHNYFTLFCNSKYGENEKVLFDMMLNRNVDGIIMMPHDSEKYLKQKVCGKVPSQESPPLVFIDNYIPGASIDFVVSDNKKGAFNAVTLCLKKGRRKIAYIGTGSNLAACNDRFEGYSEALKRAGLKPDKNLVYRNIILHENNIRITMEHIFNKEQKPDALFVESFLYFAEGFKFLYDNNITVPQKLELIGFDDPDYIVKKMLPGEKLFFRKPLPYISQDAQFIGKTAAMRLLELMRDKKQKALCIFAETETVNG